MQQLRFYCFTLKHYVLFASYFLVSIALVICNHGTLDSEKAEDLNSFFKDVFVKENISNIANFPVNS